MRANKKAISPIITTVLLVVIAMVLAVIILLWARGFISEKIAKFVPGAGEDRPIQEACDAVVLQVAVTGTNELSVVNQGDIPLYKLGVRVKDSTSGDSTVKDYDVVLSTGQSVVVPTEGQTLSGNEVSIVPILVGKDEQAGVTEYNCKNWVDVQ